ncbi:MAG: hypothetical protein ABFD97_15145 [Syntrophobacter sp.]
MKHFAYIDAEGRVQSVCSTTDDLPAFSDEHWIEEIAPGEAQKIIAVRHERDREAFCGKGIVEIRNRSVPAEWKKAARLAVLENEVENFIARRKDGGERYPVARQCALHSLFHVCRYMLDNGAGLSETEKQKLNDGIAAIMKVFAWIATVHSHYCALKNKVKAAESDAVLDTIVFDGPALDAGDPGIGLEWVAGLFHAQSPARIVLDGLK